MEIIVNECEISCNPEDSLLKCLLDAGIDIPNMCFHPALGADGRCGLCIVELKKGDHWELQLSCLIKPSQGLEVKTETDRITRMRQFSAQLLLQHSPFIKQEALTYLVKITSLGKIDPPMNTSLVNYNGTGCILCGLCVRACAKTGHGFLSFAGKGQDLHICFWPYQPECGHCQACIVVCPTGFMNEERKMKIQIDRK